MRLRNKFISFLVLFFLAFGFGFAQGPTFRIRLFDTDYTHYLQLMWNENAAANYTLNFLVNAGNRSLNMSADLTVSATASISGTNTGDNSANSLYDIGSDTQAWSAVLDTVTASTYAGDNAIVTVGTISSGIWSGTEIAATKGGTGQTVYAVGDLLYASTTTALSKLADVAVGQYLASGGVNTAPAWATLNQAAIAGLTTGSSPVFVTAKLSGLTDGYIPVHTSDAVGLANSVIFQSGTSIGIGTPTIPHGGVGTAKFAIDGTASNAAGPHIQITTSVDDYPTMSFVNWNHDTMIWLWDGYFDGINWKSSDAGSNFMITKGWNGTADQFEIGYDSGIAQGGNITWNKGIVLNTSGLVTIAGGISLTAGSITGTTVDINNAELQQISLIGATTISGTQWGYLGATGAGGGQLMAALTASESTQIEAIGAVTINVTQWGYLGASDQGIAQASSVSFSTVTSSTGDFIANDSINDTDAGRLTFRKNRAGAIVQTNDYLGIIEFYGWDTDSYAQAGLITCSVDAAPSNGTDMPGGMRFWTTPDGSATPVSRLYINNAGTVDVPGNITVSGTVDGQDIVSMADDIGTNTADIIVINAWILTHGMPLDGYSQMSALIETLEARIAQLEAMVLNKVK